MAKTFDPKVIEAEENLLIDFQFLIQELMSEADVTRSQLAEKAGISKARLTQILRAEANPTVKSMARLAHALGEAISVSRKPREQASGRNEWNQQPPERIEWSWERRAPTTSTLKVDDQLVAVIKGENVSNDNHPRVMYMDSDLPLALEPEAA